MVLIGMRFCALVMRPLRVIHQRMKFNGLKWSYEIHALCELRFNSSLGFGLLWLSRANFPHGMNLDKATR